MLLLLEYKAQQDHQDAEQDGIIRDQRSRFHVVSPPRFLPRRVGEAERARKRFAITAPSVGA